jgi:hypothetical protein
MKIIDNICHISDIPFGKPLEYNHRLYIRVEPDEDICPKIKKGTALLVDLCYGTMYTISEEGTVKRSRARIVK